MIFYTSFFIVTILPFFPGKKNLFLTCPDSVFIIWKQKLWLKQQKD